MQNHITQLENAIRDIDRVKHQLHQNTAQVKSQIQTSISRHLEALRNREVWLLNQVELLQSAKEEILHVQQARLNKQLGVAQLGSQCDNRVCEKFDMCDLKPEENSYVTFRADSSGLRDSINSYGKVDVNGLPHSVFVQPGNPSTSLPRHFEDYDDAEHHVLYKTVEEINRANGASSCIDVLVPKLSLCSEDWLARPSTTTVTSVTSPKISLPVLSDQTSDWLKLSSKTIPMKDNVTAVHTTNSKSNSIMSDGLSSSSSMPAFNTNFTNASTKSWLKQITHDLEDEDDFEIVEKSSSIGSEALDDIEIPDTFVLPSSHSAPDLQEYENKSSQWLMTDNSNDRTYTNNKTYDVFEHYFATQAMEKSKWLASTNCTENKVGSCSEKCKMGSGVDIENLGLCETKSMWLKTEPRSTKDDIKWLCKANEPCSGIGECVSKPNCLTMYLQENCSARADCSQVCKGFEVYLGKPDKKTWLLNGGKNAEEVRPLKCHMFDHILTSASSNWLRNNEVKTDKSSNKKDAVSFDHINQDSRAWLKAGSVQSLSTSVIQHDMPKWEYNAPTSAESWLLSNNDKDNDDQVKKSKVMNEPKVISDNEKWLLSSSSSDQNMKVEEEKKMNKQSLDNNSAWLISS